MTIRIRRKADRNGLKTLIGEMTGVDFSACYQCRKCTAGCPAAGSVKTSPSEIMRRLHLDMEPDDVLSCDIVRVCMSCETCHARCPMGIDIPRVMDALRILARERDIGATGDNLPLFNRAFLETVRRFGRTWDIAMIAAYKLGTMKLLQDTGKFPTMLKKGKIALLPPGGADKAATRRVFDRTKKHGKL